MTSNKIQYHPSRNLTLRTLRKNFEVLALKKYLGIPYRDKKTTSMTSNKILYRPSNL
jgi:hypothetical protein